MGTGRSASDPKRLKFGMGSVIVAVLAIGLHSPTLAQTQAQSDRFDTLARYTVTASICEALGFSLTPDAADSVGEAVMLEFVSSGLDKLTADRLASAAAERQLQILKIDNEAALASIKTEQGLKNLSAYFVRHGKGCVQAAVDPLFSRFLSAPEAFDLQKAATNAADKLLAAAGFASWQTPAIQERGNLLLVAGACRQQVGGARSDELFNTYARSDDPRERAYYIESYDSGLADDELRELDKSQCERAISVFMKKVGTR